jgi:hypothetical protein
LLPVGRLLSESCGLVSAVCSAIKDPYTYISLLVAENNSVFNISFITEIPSLSKNFYLSVLSAYAFLPSVNPLQLKRKTAAFYTPV